MRLLTLTLLMVFIPEYALADPLDAGEGYVNRGAPDMLGYAGLAMLMLNYVLFGLAAVVFGKALVQKAAWLEYIAHMFAQPWSFAIRKQEQRHWVDLPLTIIFIVVWIFFCQWLNESGLGALAMIGLALMSVLFLKSLRD